MLSSSSTSYKNYASGFIIAFIILAVSPTGSSIYIPLTGKVPRCMIVYSVGQAQTVKLDITFPALPDQQIYQYYQISWKNTENNQFASQSIKNGRFKKQLALTQNVIYDLCIRAQSNRDYGIVHIQYNANNLFAVNQAQIKIPQNLLKSEDISESFMNANTIQNNLEAFIRIQQQKSQKHDQIFRKTNKISERLVQISVVEVVVIVLAGVYQFWMLWRYLKGKHYV